MSSALYFELEGLGIRGEILGNGHPCSDPSEISAMDREKDIIIVGWRRVEETQRVHRHPSLSSPIDSSSHAIPTRYSARLRSFRNRPSSRTHGDFFDLRAGAAGECDRLTRMNDMKILDGVCLSFAGRGVPVSTAAMSRKIKWELDDFGVDLTSRVLQ